MVTTRRNDRRLTTSGTDWVKNGDRWIVDRIELGALHVRRQRSGLRATLPAAYVKEHVELGYASTVHTAQGMTADVMHGIVTGTETRQTLYTMLTRGRVENHVHVILGTSQTHAVPSPSSDSATVTEMLEGMVARDGAAASATSVRVAAASLEAQLADAVTRYADAVALAASRLRASLDDTPDGPLPWLAGIPSEVAASGWGSYLAARANRVSLLAASVRESAALPEWTLRYDDVVDPDLRGDLAVWRAARGIRLDDKSLTGPVPDDDREAAYHRHLNRTMDARYGEAIGVWERKILDYTGRRDDHTAALAKQPDSLARAGHNADRLLDLAVARKPLPVDHPTSARSFPSTLRLSSASWLSTRGSSRKRIR